MKVLYGVFLVFSSAKAQGGLQAHLELSEEFLHHGSEPSEGLHDVLGSRRTFVG